MYLLAYLTLLIRAVSPSLFCIFRLAPALIRISHKSFLPCITAIIRAVSPSLFCIFRLAPALIRISYISILLDCTAIIRAVSPKIFCLSKDALTSLPVATPVPTLATPAPTLATPAPKVVTVIIYLNISILPDCTAIIRSVKPCKSLSSKDAPASTHRMTSGKLRFLISLISSIPLILSNLSK